MMKAAVALYNTWLTLSQAYECGSMEDATAAARPAVEDEPLGLGEGPRHQPPQLAAQEAQVYPRPSCRGSLTIYSGERRCGGHCRRLLVRRHSTQLYFFLFSAVYCNIKVPAGV